MSKKGQPLYLSHTPTGEDNFKGQSHNNLASKISTIIATTKLENKVIGIEGDWGAGKSNLISLIRKNLKDSHHTFIFDAWGNQEDLTRRSFLEQLINELFTADLLVDQKKWERKEKELLSKISRKDTQKFPAIKSYVIIFASAIISISILSGLYENVFSDWDIIPSVNFKYFKSLISIYLIPVGLFLWGLFHFIKEWGAEIRKNSKLEERLKKTKKRIFLEMFYWFNGNDLVTKEIENILDDEPSVLRFRKYFSEIEEDLKQTDKKLIVVFDNLDRLQAEKVTSLWSSIHTFFAETTNSNESWIIIPYNKKELIEHFGNDNKGIFFIEKSISIEFRVTPPVVSEWEDFLIRKLSDSFALDVLPERGKERIVKIFDAENSGKTIRPRNIISFVNKLVSLWIQWEDELKREEMRIDHLALFALIQDSLLAHIPTESILMRTYLSNTLSLFDGDKFVDQAISALVFGVPMDMANEVLLRRELEDILRKGESEKIIVYMDHPAFGNYFRKAFDKIVISDKNVEQLPKILELISEKVTSDIIYYWKNFGTEYARLDSHFDKFNDTIKALLLNVQPNVGNEIIKSLTKNLSAKTISNNDVAQTHYFDEIFKAKEFIESKKLSNLILVEQLPKLNFKVEPFLHAVSEVELKINEFNITCDEDAFTKYFYEDEEREIINIEKVFKNLETLHLLKENFSSERIFNSVKEFLKNTGLLDENMLSKALKIIKSLYKDEAILKLHGNIYTEVASKELKNEGLRYEILSIGISNFKEAETNGHFVNLINTLDEDGIHELCSVLQEYLSYHNLLKLVSNEDLGSMEGKILKIVWKLTTENYGTSRLNLGWSLQNFENISACAFDEEEEKEITFLKKLGGWSENYTEEMFEQIDERVFEYFEKVNNSLMTKLKTSAVKHLNSLNKSEIIEALGAKNRSYKIFHEVLNSEFDTKYSDEIHSGYDDFIKDILKSKREFDTSNAAFWTKLLNSLLKQRMRSTYTSVRNFITEHDELNENEITFLADGLLRFGNLGAKKSLEGVMLNVVIPMIKSRKCFENLFLENWRVFTDIISDSKEHKETAIGELRVIYNEGNFLEKTNFKELVETLKLDKEEK